MAIIIADPYRRRLFRGPAINRPLRDNITRSASKKRETVRAPGPREVARGRSGPRIGYRIGSDRFGRGQGIAARRIYNKRSREGRRPLGSCFAPPPRGSTSAPRAKLVAVYIIPAKGIIKARARGRGRGVYPPTRVPAPSVLVRSALCLSFWRQFAPRAMARRMFDRNHTYRYRSAFEVKNESSNVTCAVIGRVNVT